MSAVVVIVAVACVALVVITTVWAIMFQVDLLSLLQKILDIALLPFKLFIRLFTGSSSAGSTGPSPLLPAKPQPTVTTITKNEIGQCPPCDVKCPDVPVDNKSGPLELEIRYLKAMLKFVGSIAKRENAINAQYRELYPGFSVMSPAVQRLSTEYNFLKNQIREDESEYSYFKNYFTKLTGIPSTSSAVHYDLMM